MRKTSIQEIGNKKQVKENQEKLLRSIIAIAFLIQIICVTIFD